MKKFLFIGLFLLLIPSCGKDNSGDVGRYRYFETRSGNASGFLDSKTGYALMFIAGKDSTVIRAFDVRTMIEKRLPPKQ